MTTPSRAIRTTQPSRAMSRRSCNAGPRVSAILSSATRVVLLAHAPGHWAKLLLHAQSIPTSARGRDSTRARGLDTLKVVGRIDSLLGIAATASEGRVGAVDLRSRPIAREGELLETVPGLVVTQHSGEGKANQYFVRGFNLDHGTDFQTRIEGMPVNMASHAHGQGYTDLNFLIPELVYATIISASITRRSGISGARVAPVSPGEEARSSVRQLRRRGEWHGAARPRRIAAHGRGRSARRQRVGL